MNRERLLTLASHLDTVDPERFDFQTVGELASTESVAAGMEVPLTCMTNGCAVGCLPRIWPETFRMIRIPGTYSRIGIEHRSGQYKSYMSMDIAQKWLDLTPQQMDRLFVPSVEYDYVLDGDDFTQLGVYTTASEVAAHIRRFCAMDEEELAIYFPEEA